jgi:protein involved in polysaccharide export with SLBB domain
MGQSLIAAHSWTTRLALACLVTWAAMPLAQAQSSPEEMMDRLPSRRMLGGLPDQNEETSSSGGMAPMISPGGQELLRGEAPSQSQQQDLLLPVPLERPINPDEYICNRGDQLMLNFWGKQNFVLPLGLDAEGRAFVPRVGYLDLAGRTLTQARELTKKLVSRYYPKVNFELSLVAPRRFVVHVIDYVGNPGAYTATPIDRVSTIVSHAAAAPSSSILNSSGTQAVAQGGSKGSRRNIEITHADGTKITADLVMYELTGDLKQNPYVQDGDVIRVPHVGVIVDVDGAVRRPGSYELTKTNDLTEAIALADGLSLDVARQLPLTIVRRDEQQHMRRVTMSMGASGLPNVPLHYQDEVHVPTAQELQRTILLQGAIAGANPIDPATTLKRMAFVEGDTVRTLIERAGGLGPSADLPGAYIKRGNERGQSEGIDLERLLVRRDFSADRPVGLGDVIVVPYRKRGVSVEGAVLKPGTLQFNPNFSINQYVAGAGGALNRIAEGQSDYRVITPEGHTKRNNTDLKVEPGDTILVPEKKFSSAEVASLVFGSAGLLISSISFAILISRQ